MWPTIFGSVLVISSVSSFSANTNDQSIIVRFVIEATKANGIGPSPSTVSAFLCMKKEEQVILAKHASQNEIFISVKNPLDHFDRDIFSRDSDQHQSYYLLDADCPGAFNILQKADSTGMFIAPTKWLLIQDLRGERNVNSFETAGDNLHVYDLFKNLSVLPDSDVVIGQRIDTHYVRLISAYKPSAVRQLVIENRGYWEDGKGISLNSTQVSSVRRKNLKQTALKSCLVPRFSQSYHLRPLALARYNVFQMTDPDSVHHLTDFHDKHIDPITKANYPWVIFLVEMMNATVSFSIENSWGYRDSNGTWSGMIGMLHRKEIDLGGTTTFFTAERVDVIQYVSLHTPTRAGFIFRRPPLSYVSNIFVLPFRPSVWVASIVFLVLVAGLLYVAWKWEWHSTSEKKNCVHVSWSDNILITIGAVSQQGSTFEPRGVSARIILLMLFVAVLSLYTSYTANIVALLQSSTSSINTLDKLLHSTLKFGVHDNIYNRHYFAQFQDPVRKAIYEQKIIPRGQKPAWMSMEDGVSRLRKGLFAFHAECGSAYKVIQETFHEDEKCGFEELDYFNVLAPLMAIQKHSPYLDIIKVGALKIHESGLQTRQMNRLYTEKPVCHGHTSFVSVGLIDCYAAFALLAWGMLLSLIILFLEIIWQRRKVQRAYMDTERAPRVKMY